LPYSYHFGTATERSSGVIYETIKDSPNKFTDAFVVKYHANKENWIVPDDVDESTIDYHWMPDALAEPFIYAFPTKYQRESGVYYHVPGATKKKFIDVFTVTHLRDESCFHVPDDIVYDSVDFTWRPDKGDRPFNYCFGTKFQPASGVTYSGDASATENKFVNSPLVKHKPSKDNWVIPSDIENPNLTWRPNPLDPPYIYKFPSQYVRESGLEYHVPGATETKFVDDITVSFDAEACQSKLKSI